MSYRDDVLNALDVRAFAVQQGIDLGKKVGADEFRFLCPFHPDTEPSANWNVKTGLWRCQACNKGGSPIDFLMERGLDYKDALLTLGQAAGIQPPERRHTNGAAAAPKPATEGGKPKPGPVARTRRFEAIDTSGHVWQHARKEDKTGRSIGGMTWQPGVKIASLQPYGSRELASWAPDDPVFLVEGEATAEALRAMNLPALATFGVSYKPEPAALEALRDRNIILWPDADDVGRAHMLDMAKRLSGIASALRWIEPPADVFKGWDAADADTPTVVRLVSEAGAVPSSVAALEDTFTLAMLDRAPAPPLLLDRLDPIETTILYGPGGVGKGTLACRWISDLVIIREMRVLILDYENHGPEWARRIFGLAGADVLDNIEWRAPLAERRGPIWKHAEWVRDTCSMLDIGYVVIDSAMMACGKDPLETDAPQEFFEATQIIGVPSLTLGHVTKLHDARYPFGSIFWHNIARVTWSLMPKGEDIILTHRKANNYAKVSPQAITTTWHDGVLGEVTERPAAFSLLDKLADALEDGEAKTVQELAAILNEGLDAGDRTSSNAIRAVFSRELARNRDASRFTVDGSKRWSLRADDDAA